MKIEQLSWSPKTQWSRPSQLSEANLVLVFADTPYFETAACFDELRARYPRAEIVSCSSSGNVQGVSISDESLVVTAVQLERGHVTLAVADIVAGQDSAEAGAALLRDLGESQALKHVFVLTDGLMVNGSELAKGMNRANLPVTGGMAGDGTRFAATRVMANAPAKSGRIAAIGFSGGLQVNSGWFAGWDEFGAERVITRSVGNVVYEFDGQPALALYKKYLAEQAADLPASGLRFPLSVQADKDSEPLIRTLLGVDEAAQSLTFAGDVPQGHLCKLMKTNLDSLIENAGRAAEAALPVAPHEATGLCLVVSCVGRRLVMRQLVEEELDIVQEKLGADTVLTGFYSYGELAPFSDIMQCQLHNQTITLTTIYE